MRIQYNYENLTPTPSCSYATVLRLLKKRLKMKGRTLLTQISLSECQWKWLQWDSTFLDKFKLCALLFAALQPSF